MGKLAQTLPLDKLTLSGTKLQNISENLKSEVKDFKKVLSIYYIFIFETGNFTD
jgi:hypothetical protein